MQLAEILLANRSNPTSLAAINSDQLHWADDELVISF
jgi:hypothetical protein